jgi:hypothetical protein
LNILYLMSKTGCHLTLFSLSPSKTELLLVSLPQQLSELSTPIIHLSNCVTQSHVNSVRNLGVIVESNLTFSQQISVVPKS